MQAIGLSTVDWILDKYFLSEEEMAEVRKCIKELKVEPAIEQIAEVLKITPRETEIDVDRLQKMDVSGFAFELAQIFIPKINSIKEPRRQQFAAEKLGEIVQYFGLDLWKSVMDLRPDFIKDFMVGFKRFNAGTKIDCRAFFNALSPGYFHKLQKEFESASNQKPKGFWRMEQSNERQARNFDDHRKIEFNKKSEYGRRLVNFANLMSDYGLVRDKRQIKGFFNAEDQSGTRVKCYGEKRNHIALLFDRLIKEEILIVRGGKGHWPILQQCFVDEKGDSLSKSFSKLLSKLRTEEDQKQDIFEEIERFMSDFKR